MRLDWQSKFVLLVVLPAVGVDLCLEIPTWAAQNLFLAVSTLGICALFGLVTFLLRAATPAASMTGAVIAADLMFSTAVFPYHFWRTALLPVLAVFLLAFAATRLGRGRKQRLGTAESRNGRSASQVAANLGVTALVSTGFAQSIFSGSRWFQYAGVSPVLLFTVGLAALSEAAADTVSSEIGQVFGERPRMITTLRVAEPGTNGAVSPAGTLAGMLAATIVAATGALALRGNAAMFVAASAGGIFGFLFDSFLGAVLEQHSWLNNDAVNFLSTAAASGFALSFLAALG
jgi:uncharacterized protein (TIGR00297 family)